ncbi:MAG: dTDP-4-dehydrorhamnose reductase [Planctomycetota bacterium]|jgi:dTDP-4-dehydrorhamnose reductase
MRLAVIGAAGQVGQEFTKCLAKDALVPLAREQVDVVDSASVDACIDRLDCEVIINLAAFHDVNGCESNIEKAFQVNAVGAGNVARAAAREGRKLVYFSSDYVFRGDVERRAPYRESDPPDPVNVYGVSKVAGEHLVRIATDNHLIIRSSSLFGVVTSKKGWTFPEMILQRAKAGEPLRVVNDQYMSPTYTLDLVREVMALLEAGATGTVHVTNASGCTWYDFAKATLDQAGVEHPVEPVDSDAFPAIARRPVYSRLDSERLESFGVEGLRDWRESLQAYLIEKGVIGA